MGKREGEGSKEEGRRKSEEVRSEEEICRGKFQRKVNWMSNSILMEKSKSFAVHVIRVCNEVHASRKEYTLTDQLFRSGTSVGANIREAFYGSSTADFINKLHIALKECAESEYWIELLTECGYYKDDGLLAECVEVKKILVSSLNTAKSRR